MSTQQQPPVLVLGGTGKVGRRVVARLTARGVPVRVGSRGCDPVFDWNTPATWPAALDGIQAWTIVRCSWFAQNCSENFLLEPVLAGDVALPVATITEPFVDCDDIADIAAEALLGDRHAGELYELTGPRPLTFSDAIQEIARAANRPIRFAAIPLDQYTAALASEGLAEEEVALVAYLFSTVLDGRNSSVTDGVSRALGRPPRDFAEYARHTAATGAWSP